MSKFKPIKKQYSVFISAGKGLIPEAEQNY